MLPLEGSEVSEKSLDTSQESIVSKDSFDVAKGVKENVSGIQESTEYPTQKQIRIYLLRHYPESGTVGEYYTKLEEIPEKLKQAYDGIFANPGKTFFIYDSENLLPRVRSTAEDLLTNYPIPENHIFRDVKLEGSYDTDEDPIKRKIRTLEEFEALKKTIQERNLSEIDTIVIISNRTYTQPFDLLSGNKKDITKQSLEAKGYQFRDFNVSLNPIIPKSTSLIISPEIYQFLKEIFEIESESCQELQEKIERLFAKDSTLFSKFLTHPTSPTSLRTFCLANLIAQKDYDTIEEYYLYDSTYISKEEKEIFFKNTQNADMQAIPRMLFVSRYEDFWKDHNPEELRTRLGEDFYTLLQSNQTSHAKAMELQKLSLDEMILAKESEAILPRHVYYLTKSDSDPQKENEVSLDFRKIWESGDKYLLRAHVGQGKSFWLTEFVKYAAIRGRTVIFYQAKDLGQIKDQGEIKRIFDDAEAQGAILCIDAIDEIAERGIKTYIKECIDRFSGACVVTARESEYPGTNQGFVTLAVKPMDSNAFLESRFLDQDDALEKVRSILQENHLDREVEGNPLLLTLVVLLAKMDTDDKGEYSKLGIKPLDDIRNKADLYESIVRFILTKHSKGIKGQSYTRKDLDRWVDELGVYAYEMFSQNGFPTVDETDAEDFDTHLSLLFQKTQDHQYDFIHKSFYEFFLARHLLERGDGNEEIYRFRNACAEPSVAQWNEWRDFRPVVMFYGEMLANNGNIDTLKQFLGEKGLLEYDDIFGENFFMGLEILYTWPEEERSRDPIRGVLEKYIKKVRKWDIEEVIKKFELVKSLSKNIGYVDTEVFKEIISHLLKTFSLKIINESVQGYNYETISRLIAEIGTPEAIYEAAEKADKIGIGNKVAQRIYLSIIEIQTPEAIRVAVKGAETAIERKRFWGSVELYCTIARIGTSEAMQAAAKGAETLVRKWGGIF